MDDGLEGDLADLQLALALGPKEAGAVREEVVSTAYRSAHRFVDSPLSSKAAACTPAPQAS